MLLFQKGTINVKKTFSNKENVLNIFRKVKRLHINNCHNFSINLQYLEKPVYPLYNCYINFYFLECVPCFLKKKKCIVDVKFLSTYINKYFIL